MRVGMLLAAALFTFLALPTAAQAAEPAKLCVRASRPTEYNAHAIGPHDLWIADVPGARTPVRAAPTCIHLRPDSRVNLRSDFQCVGMGDNIGVATPGLPGEQCRISKVTEFVPGSEAEGYR